VTGEIDFLTIFTNTTDGNQRLEYVFNKYDKMLITVFNANVSNTGEFTHRGLEDEAESVNTGLSSHLTRAHYTNLIKAGIFLETNHHFLFDLYNVSNIQSKFYAAHTNDWYDILNSTIDYNLLIKVDNSPEPQYANTTHIFVDDPYFAGKLWIGTNNDIIQYKFNDNNELEIEDIIRPGGGFNALLVWDIFVTNSNAVYVVAEEHKTSKGHIFRTYNFGVTWEDLDTINLPDEIYSFKIVNGTFVAGTKEGLFYSDNDFGTWYPGDVVLSEHLPDDSPSLAAFRDRIRNLDFSTFMVVESDRWFYSSGSGIEFFSLGRIINNSCTVVNKVFRFKNLTWVGTDRGLYDDGNSLLSNSVQFGLATDLEVDTSTSASTPINDITSWGDALYACSDNGKIYRYWDEDPNDNVGNEWKRYKVPDFGAIQKITPAQLGDTQFLIVISYNKIKSIDVTPTTGVFG
ncbi:hypothetical protein LCGC14_1438980, partial [marine sediment metagenome]